LSNIRLDLTITDAYGGAPAKKTVSLLVASGGAGAIRTENRLGPYTVQLNIDAYASIVAEGLVRANVTFEYTPAQPSSQNSAQASPANLHESMSVLLKSGQPLMVSQSADPATDRRVTVELTATELK
jgi:hypothetical protein